jgi:formylglycine-generating enzyme required for sulfatase activity
MSTAGATVSRRTIVIQAIAATLGAQPANHVDSFDGARPGSERRIGPATFRWAPPGSFRMGSPPFEPERRTDEGPVSVTLSRGFWIGQYEVTQAQWRTLVGQFPRPQDKGVGDDYPLHWVSYLEAVDFCRKLTERAWTSRELPRSWEVALPTEAQWEYACRAGTSTATSFGDRLNGSQANFSGYARDVAGGRVTRKESSPVGSFPANAWGLYDMHGNVWEWCRDWYHSTLPGGIDPDFSATQGTVNRDGTYSRVRRGGAWIEEGWACRSAMRLRYEPERRSDHIGFRVVAVRK